jgi:hypothetical protein
MKVLFSKYTIILICLIVLVISLLQIVNLTALYKDQVEMKIIMTKNLSSNFCFDLIDEASKMTSYINFFQYLSFTSGIIIVYLIWKK